MRLKIFIMAVLGTVVSATAVAQQTAKVTNSKIAYLEYLPQGYNNNANLYPLVISLHGIVERGTTSTDIATLKASAEKVANVGLAKYIKYGQQYPFIVISPQLKTSHGTWPAAYVMDVINHVKKDLRVDPKRIYITGLSLGGFGVWTTIGAYPDVFAAAIPICAGGNALNRAQAIAAADVAVWGFHGDKDNTVSYTVTTRMVSAINASTPKPNPLAKITLFGGLGHIIWDRVYKQTNALDWMLTFKRGGGTSAPPPPPSGAAPTVSAGPDRTITLPTNSIDIQGSASDADGIASYRWTKASGGQVGFQGHTTSKLRAFNLVAGTYVFRFTVTDKKGNSTTDLVTVTVKAATSSDPGPGTTTPGNKAPIANAGPDRDVKLPASSLKLNGSASDSDGTIVSYHWTQYGGPSTATISGGNTASPTMSGLQAGKYYFRLTVKDNTGATAIDNMLVRVNK